MKAHWLVRHERPLETGEDAQAAEAARMRRRTIAAAFVVAIVLAFAEREVYGSRDGSFRALLAPYLAAISCARPC